MFDIECEVLESKIPNAGRGIFTQVKIKKAKIIVYPNTNHQVVGPDKLEEMDKSSVEYNSSIRWFEDKYTVDPEWSKECFFNHSFEPNCLWHLGFIFALRDIHAGEELTIDYSNLLDENIIDNYPDSVSGKVIRGISYKEKMQKSAQLLAQLFSE